MIIEKLVIKNYKMFTDAIIQMNSHINIFVGENDSGKTTILEALSIVLTGRLNGQNIGNKICLDLFNNSIRNGFRDAIKRGETPVTPQIIIEAYIKNDGLLPPAVKAYQGTNNMLLEDAVGVRIQIGLNNDYRGTYKQLVKEGKVTDIPIELYKIEFCSFARPEYYINVISKKIAFIDTTKKDYGSVLSRFVSTSINSYLTDDQMTGLRLAYRSNRSDFINDIAVQELNSKLKENNKFRDKIVSLNLREGDVDDWKNEMEIVLDGVPLENMGFGTQNMFKSEMVVQQNSDIDILVMEEPENNLSYSNMSLLISRLSEEKERQLFISTHSSYVANKLGLNSIQLVKDGVVKSFSSLNKDTYEFFTKLPGFNTLRVVLANKVILVEGPADELIVQRAYLDYYGKLPIEDGIDVIAVSGVGFQRYCDVAKLINKKITVVTDNDNNYQVVKDRYSKYDEIVTLCVEENNRLHTLEPSVLEANKLQFEDFRSIVYSGNDVNSKSYEDILRFMETDRNKTTWSFRVFMSEKRIQYPAYIMKAIGCKDE